MRRTSATAAIVMFVLLGSVSRLVAGAPMLIKGPMVQMVSETGLTIVWETGGSVEARAEIRREDGSWADPDAVVESREARRAVRFEGLKSGTEYRYRVLVGKEVVAEHTVSTAPRAGEPFRILAFGDSGSGDEHQYRLAERMADVGADIVVHTGDLIYMEGKREYYVKKFYRPYASLIATLPFYPAVGNHDFLADGGAPIFEEFVLPENGPESSTPERHYWFDFGGVRFVAIDTDLGMRDLGTIVTPWLDKVLADAGDRWKIVFCHHPAYANARYGPTHRLWQTILPVMEARGVHLVLAGHSHLYERTHPVREHKIVPPGKGIVHVVTGAGGGGLHAIKPEPLEQLAVQYNDEYSFTIIDVTAEHLALKQIDTNGKQVDECIIPRAAPPDHPEVDTPEEKPGH